MYFPHITSIRFFAALLVFIHHVEQFKRSFELPYFDHKWIENAGYFGVQIFFVLSGFLISSILFRELKMKGKVSLRKFYLKRVYRIWPLFYLIFFVSIVFYFIFFNLQIPDGILWPLNSKSIILSILLLPNFGYVFFQGVPFFLHSWSIGVEEQFYVFWPLLFLKKNNFLLVISLILVIFSSYDFINSFGKELMPILYDNVHFDRWHSFNIEPMLWGAWVFFLYERFSETFVKLIANKLTLSIFLLFNGITFFGGFWFPLFHFQIMSLSIGLLIASFAFQKNRFSILENTVMNYLGNISYGIYMIHPFVLFVYFYLSESPGSICTYVVCLSITLLLSSLSYEYFEKSFLRLKNRL